MHTYERTHTHTHTEAGTHPNTDMHTPIHTWACTCTHSRARTHMAFSSAYEANCMCESVRLSVYVCAFTCARWKKTYSRRHRRDCLWSICSSLGGMSRASHSSEQRQQPHSPACPFTPAHVRTPTRPHTRTPARPHALSHTRPFAHARTYAHTMI